MLPTLCITGKLESAHTVYEQSEEELRDEPERA